MNRLEKAVVELKDELIKARPTKYISRKPDGKGGWIYTYVKDSKGRDKKTEERKENNNDTKEKIINDIIDKIMEGDDSIPVKDRYVFSKNEQGQDVKKLNPVKRLNIGYLQSKKISKNDFIKELKKRGYSVAKDNYINISWQKEGQIYEGSYKKNYNL